MSNIKSTVLEINSLTKSITHARGNYHQVTKARTKGCAASSARREYIEHLEDVEPMLNERDMLRAQVKQKVTEKIAKLREQATGKIAKLREQAKA